MNSLFESAADLEEQAKARRPQADHNNSTAWMHFEDKIYQPDPMAPQQGFLRCLSICLFALCLPICPSTITVVVVAAARWTHNTGAGRDPGDPLHNDTDLEHDPAAAPRVQRVQARRQQRQQPQQQPQQQPRQQPRQQHQPQQHQQQAPIQVELLPAASGPMAGLAQINLMRPVQAQPQAGHYCHFQDLDSPSGLCGGQPYTWDTVCRCGVVASVRCEHHAHQACNRCCNDQVHYMSGSGHEQQPEQPQQPEPIVEDPEVQQQLDRLAQDHGEEQMRQQQAANAPAAAQPDAAPDNSINSDGLALDSEPEEQVDTPPRKARAKRCRTADRPSAVAVTTRSGRVTKRPNLEAEQSD